MSRHLNELSRRRMRLKKSIITLSAAILGAIGLAYAWFVTSQKLAVDELEFVSVAAINSKIAVTTDQAASINDLVFSETADLKDINPGGDGTMEELSGLGYMKIPGTAANTDAASDDAGDITEPAAGELQLFKLRKDSFTGELTTETEDGCTTYLLEAGTLTANEDYLEFDVYIKTDLSGKVYLTEESAIAPVSTSTDPEKNNRISSFGDFSTDYIAAATRMSVCEVAEDGTEYLTLLWAPNPNVELIAPKTTGTDAAGSKIETENPLATSGWTLKTGEADDTTEKGEPEKEYSYFNGSGVAELKNGDRISSNSVNKNEDSLEDNVGIFKETLTDSDTGCGIYVGALIRQSATDTAGTTDTIADASDEDCLCHLRIRVWVEGFDRETKAPLSGGQFRISLVFQSVED